MKRGPYLTRQQDKIKWCLELWENQPMSQAKGGAQVAFTDRCQGCQFL